MKRLGTPEITEFRETVWRYFEDHGRQLPWREDPTPYKVLVSELMLQQTQVARVAPKFDAFLRTFADFASLADASLAEVLTVWSGLGYNRRAKFLHQAAMTVMRDHGGVLPDTLSGLVSLPGIGKNTAGAILAYAYEQPAVFIETNIRTVYFHHFYIESHELVDDKELANLVEQTMDRDSPREWYWALMDYGTHLKKTAGARLTSSRHYVKQSPLKGSAREMRGRIVRGLVAGKLPVSRLRKMVEGDERFEPALHALQAEGLIEVRHDIAGLTGKGRL